MSEIQSQESSTEKESSPEVSIADEIHLLLEQHRQLLKTYKMLAADVSDRFIAEVGKDVAKKYVALGQKCKASKPSDFEAAKQLLDVKMSSFIANKRVQDQKPLNRKGVSKRTWV
jgi:hypothetical protein